jgi:hypothetical protein
MPAPGPPARKVTGREADAPDKPGGLAEPLCPRAARENQRAWARQAEGGSSTPANADARRAIQNATAA